MLIEEIKTKYGVTKLEKLYDSMHNWSVSDLIDELIELYPEDTIANIMRNLDKDEEDSDGN